MLTYAKLCYATLSCATKLFCAILGSSRRHDLHQLACNIDVAVFHSHFTRAARKIRCQPGMATLRIPSRKREAMRTGEALPGVFHDNAETSNVTCYSPAAPPAARPRALPNTTR